MPTLDENAKHRNNVLHKLCRMALGQRWAMTGDYMKILFEKEVLA
jgi:hypothetical protein